MAINALLRRPLAKRSLDDLTAEDVAAYRDQRLGTVKPSTISRELSWLQHALDLAQREWGFLLRSNPVRTVRRPRIDNRRERRLRVGERERLIRAAQACGNPLMNSVIVLALESGMRRGELTSMRWEHFDAARCVVHLPKTKNGHARTVPLSPTATEVIDLLPREDGEPRILPISGNAVRLNWERLRARAGIEDVCFYDLRHEAISSFFERGLSMPEVAMISGHRDARMLMPYTHLHAVNIVAKLHDRPMCATGTSPGCTRRMPLRSRGSRNAPTTAATA